MSATILTFPVPTRQQQLNRLIGMAQAVLSDVTDDHLDRFLDRLERWEASASAK